MYYSLSRVWVKTPGFCLLNTDFFFILKVKSSSSVLTLFCKKQQTRLFFVNLMAWIYGTVLPLVESRRCFLVMWLTGKCVKNESHVVKRIQEIDSKKKSCLFFFFAVRYQLSSEPVLVHGPGGGHCLHRNQHRNQHSWTRLLEEKRQMMLLLSNVLNQNLFL